jgi:hypothetical protein
MRKFSRFSFVLALLCLVSASCNRKPELKKMRALVTNVTVHSDTLINMTVNSGEDSTVFNLADVRLNNGLMLAGDSVIIDYMDGKDEPRAMVVTILPKATQSIDIKHPNESAPLKTADPKKVNEKFEY